MRAFAFLLGFLIGHAFSTQITFLSTGVQSISSTYPACMQLSPAWTMISRFNETAFTQIGANMTKFAGTHNFAYINNFLTTPPNTERVTLTKAVLGNNLLQNNGQITYDPTYNNGATALTIYFANATTGFKLGDFYDDVLFYSPYHSFSFKSSKNTIVSNTFSSLSTIFSNPNPLLTGNLQIVFKTPCAFLPVDSLIAVAFSAITSNLSIDYNVNPLLNFSTQNCNVTINGTRLPGMRCSIIETTLFISGWTTSVIMNQVTISLNIFGIMTPPAFLPAISLQMYKGLINSSARFLNSNLAFNIVQLTLNSATQSFSPTIIKKENLKINLQLSIAKKIPLPAGYSIWFKLSSQFDLSNPLGVTITNLFNNMNESKNIIATNGYYKFVTGQTYLMDYGMQINLQYPMTPSTIGISTVIISLWTNAGKSIAGSYTLEMNFNS